MQSLQQGGVVPDAVVIQKILLIRGRKVMIDADLAELYGVTTKRLNEQVKRNRQRFPPDFMFQLTTVEKEEVVANCDHLSRLKFSPNLPFAFTEHGSVMAASVLNSDRAIAMHIQIVRVFNAMREMLLMHKDVLIRLEQIESKLLQQDDDLKSVFYHLRQLLSVPKKEREPIGF